MEEVMNARQRYLATFRFAPCPRTPRWEMGYWAGTIQRWYEEGLPGKQQAVRLNEPYAKWVNGFGQGAVGQTALDRDFDVASYFNMDKAAVSVELYYTIYPPYDIVVLEETEKYVIKQEESGIISKHLKPDVGMPEWIDYPVHNRTEWEQFKAERLQPNLNDRIPVDWEERLKSYRQRDYPLCLGAGLTGYFGTAREILGFERLLTSLCEDPVWMHDVFDYLACFYVTLYDKVLSQIKVDYATHWEDMCYIAGPLISPQMFAEFMLTPYKKLTSLLRDYGVDIIIVDTDGDCRMLIPLFLEGGVTGLNPFEVQSHMDVREIRREYPRLCMQGGIDKKALSADKEAIDRELETKVPVVLTGGYIPHVDHGVPPDISWENFCYYRHRLDEMLNQFDALRWKASHLVGQ